MDNDIYRFNSCCCCTDGRDNSVHYNAIVLSEESRTEAGAGAVAQSNITCPRALEQHPPHSVIVLQHLPKEIHWNLLNRLFSGELCGDRSCAQLLGSHNLHALPQLPPSLLCLGGVINRDAHAARLECFGHHFRGPRSFWHEHKLCGFLLGGCQNNLGFWWCDCCCCCCCYCSNRFL